MGIVTAGFDVHRAQIIFDALVSETGELARGRIGASPEAVEEWVAGFAECEIHVAVEACTGWLFVCEALARAGAVAHLAGWPRHGRGGDASSGPRPTVRMRAGCGCCWRRDACPRRGLRLRRSVSCVR